MPEPNILRAALWYANRGWPVFPLSPGEKVPLKGSRGFYEATCEALTISRWAKETPDANLGLRCGAASGVVVLDLDLYEPGADMALEALIAAHGPLPDTVESQTPRGGRHLFFAHPGGTVRPSAGALGLGVDVRGDGSYVLLPPSSIGGVPYLWLAGQAPHEMALAPWPDWLSGSVHPPREEPSTPLDMGDIPEGKRNDTLMRMAARLRRLGLAEDSILAALLKENAARCVPPLDAAEVQTIAHSMAKYAPSAPVGIGPDEAPERPVIRISTDLTAMTDALQDALCTMPEAPVVFQRARQLCLISRGVTAPKWLQRHPDTPVIVPLLPGRLRELAGNAAIWQKRDKRAKVWEQVLPSSHAIETLMSRPNWAFPVLEGVVCTPTLRPDGSPVTTPGYDVDTGLWLDFNGTVYPPLRRHPTLDDARTAIGRLQEPLLDFPCVARCHFSTVLAAILSLVARYAIQGNVPLFAVRSTIRGSGKGLLIDAMSLIGTGRSAPRWAQTDDPEEERKRLFTIAMAGDACSHLDNVTKALGSASLDMALTAPTFSDRILGQQVSREAPMHTVFFASGNNMQFQGDLARRVVPIDLDPGMERPEDRDNFRHSPLLPWILEQRPALVDAALTILLAYFEAGCPAQDVTPLGSFEEWSRLIRQTLIWAGEDDPCAGRVDIEAESDPQYEALEGLLSAWSARYGTTAISVKEVREDIEAHTAPDGHRTIIHPDWRDLHTALVALDRRGAFNPDAIGKALKRWKGRMLNGQRFVSTEQNRDKHRLWRVEHL